MAAQHRLRWRVLHACAQEGFQPTASRESHEPGVIQVLVSVGLGIAVLPGTNLRPDLGTVALPLPSRGARLHRQIGLAFRQDRSVTMPTRQAFSLARELFEGAAAAATEK